jgi:membrane peptidoglycan carboxypeptidase
MSIRNVISCIAKYLYRKDYRNLMQITSTLNSQIDSLKPLQDYDLLIKFLISGEDHRFRYHIGFDFIAVIRAIKNRLFYNKLEGASTIDQQLVRVLMNDYEKTLRRKIREIFLSTTLCDCIPRRKIPIIYLHVAYFGPNMQGIRQALDCLNIEVITEEVAAEIIARVKYPEPKHTNDKRNKQIALRKDHLLSLYKKHSARKMIKIYG